MPTGTIILPVQAIKLPSSNPFALDASGNHFKLLGDATTGESGAWQFRLPSNYSSSPVLKIQYTMVSATTGGVALDASVDAVSDGDSQDVDTETYDTKNTGTATVPGTAGYLDEISIPLTNNDGMAAGDFAKIKLARDPANGSDTATGDIEIIAVSLEYTTT